MCRIDGAETATIYRDRTVTARKSHKCYECGRDISAGERYRYVFTVYDGWPDSYHTCIHCVSGQDWLARECGGYIFSEVSEELHEHAQEYPPFALPLMRIAVGIRRKWRRFDKAGHMAVPAIPAARIKDFVEGVR